MPVLAVVLGAGLLRAGLAMLGATCVVYTLTLLDLISVFKRESIGFRPPSLALGARNLGYSLVLCLKAVMEMVRQQGVRLLLTPLAGVAGLAAFATIRTGANVALQGLGTITNPIMPELMRFLHQRDQARMEAAFSTVWIALLAGLSPCLLVLQLVAAPLFTLWTHGKIPFDPVLFALLSLGVLVFAAAQPAMSVAQGNNLLGPQLFLSALSAGVVIAGVAVLVPRMGILGAGWSLLLGELIAAVGYVKIAEAWLRQHELAWPKKAFFQVVLSVLVAGGSMFGIALLAKWRLAFLLGGLVTMTLIFRSYWRHFPELAKLRMASLVAGLPGGRRFCSVFMLS
jgi:O-antigen/teichoic acid export membrane protein